MSETKDIPIEKLLGATQGEPEAGHDAWFRAKVEKTLAAAKAGKLTYRTLDEVAEKFGFNAR